MPRMGRPKEKVELVFLSGMCARCKDGQLSARTNKATGEMFLGCSNFPNCRWTVPYDEALSVFLTDLQDFVLQVINSSANPYATAILKQVSERIERKISGAAPSESLH